MVTIIIGIILILIAFLLIFMGKDNENEVYKDILEKHKEIKEYSNTLDEIVNNLDELINGTINRTHANKNIYEKENEEDNYIVKGDKKDKEKINVEFSDILMDEVNIINNKVTADVADETNENSIEEEILRLNKNGLSSIEIARKLDKGIREVEIILKLSDNN